MRFPGKLGMCPSLAEPDSGGFPRSNFEMFHVKHFVATVPPEQLQNTCFPFRFHKAERSCSPRLEKLSLFSPPAPCAKRMAQGFRCLRAAIRAARPHLGSIFEKLLHRKTFYLPAARCLQSCDFDAMFHVKHSELLLEKPPETGSARLGHIPSLPGNRNCP